MYGIGKGDINDQELCNICDEWSHEYVIVDRFGEGWTCICRKCIEEMCSKFKE